MKHNLPTVPIFRDTSPGGQMEELALRVIVELPGWEMHVIGTATVIGSYLALTAKHVVTASLNYCKTKTTTSREAAVEDGELKLLQVLPGPIYRFWAVEKAWLSNSDIAVLHLRADRMSEQYEEANWRCLAVRDQPEFLYHDE
jgi:Trypsin